MGFFKKWLLSLFAIEFGLHVGKFFTTEATYALFSRLSEVTVLSFAMILGSWFFLTKRLSCTSLNINPQIRYILRFCFVILAIATHIAYLFFYVDLGENSWVVYFCFMSFAFYLHLVIISFLFFLYEQIAKRVLPDSLSIFVSSTVHTFIAFVLALALVTHGLTIVRQEPTVQSVDISIKGLPERFNGFSIALLTDVHIGPTVSRQRVEDIVRITNSLNVDAVSIVGDLIDGFLEHIRYKAMPLRDLRAKYGVFYATGNHEYYHDNINSLLDFARKDLNLTVLHNEHFLVNRDGDKICFAGVDDIKADALSFSGYKMDAEKALSGCPKDTTTVLLVHQPNAAHKILQLTKQKIDLVLSGHTHRGQFAILYPVSYVTNKFLHGLYKHKNTQIYVSAGANYWGPGVKVKCEIILIRLRPE